MAPGNAYRNRQEKVARYLKDKGLFAAVLEDSEASRSRNLRYLCGQPTDCVLFVFADGKTVLVAWDINLARERAHADEILPYADFRRSFKEAVATTLRRHGLKGDSVIELSGHTPHPRYLDVGTAIEGVGIRCEEKGIDTFLSGMRTVKDAAEIEAVRKAAEITNGMIAELEKLLRGRPSLTEFQVAQIVEREALGRGAEGLGFETLAAGPSRSWAIHPFPVYSNNPFGGAGLSILDFGVTVEGYTSDVTLTLAHGPLAPEQERMVSLVQEAHDKAFEAAAPGVSPQAPALLVDELFAKAGWKMPHALGHGIGLDAHEGPAIRSLGEPSDPGLAPGMVFTIEPGLYDPRWGGVRLEDDVLVTAGGTELLTRARIIRTE